MDKLNQYRKIIEELLLETNQMIGKNEDYETLLSLDHERGQYILMSDGWHEGKRHYHPIIHIELKINAEVWLRCDNTDLEIGEELIQKGINRKDIIPAFYSPKMRKYAQS